MVRYVALIGALAMLTAAKEPSATWDLYQGLVCHSDNIDFCDGEGSCKSARPSAVFLIDFQANTLRAAISAPRYTSTIVKKEHFPEMGYDKLYLNDRGTFALKPTEDDSVKQFVGREVKGVYAEAGFPTSTLMTMTCNGVSSL